MVFLQSPMEGSQNIARLSGDRMDIVWRAEQATYFTTCAAQKHEHWIIFVVDHNRVRPILPTAGVFVNDAELIRFRGRWMTQPRDSEALVPIKTNGYLLDATSQEHRVGVLSKHSDDHATFSLDGIERFSFDLPDWVASVHKKRVRGRALGKAMHQMIV